MREQLVLNIWYLVIIFHCSYPYRSISQLVFALWSFKEGERGWNWVEIEAKVMSSLGIYIDSSSRVEYYHNHKNELVQANRSRDIQRKKRHSTNYPTRYPSKWGSACAGNAGKWYTIPDAVLRELANQTFSKFHCPLFLEDLHSGICCWSRVFAIAVHHSILLDYSIVVEHYLVVD